MEILELSLSPPDARFKSASQIARVSTEAWALRCLYCPSGGLELTSYPQGTKVYDFFSLSCKERFQLKSGAHMFSHSVLGSELHTTLNSVLSGQQPSMFLLHYDRIKWTVEDLMVIHRSCITTSCIIPRKPLSSTARRAGWQGCIYSLDRIPKLGQIEVIDQGVIREKAEILAQWKQSDSLLRTKPELRGWVADILTCVERLPSTFKLDDMYAFEDELGKKHRDNHNIRPKIRQQLQVLRDLGLVNFVSPGVYEYLGKTNASWQ